MQPQHAIATATPTATRLAAGHALHLHAEAGTRIIVTGGRIRIVERSSWFGERLLEQADIACDGEQRVIRQRGWITLEANEMASLICVAPVAKEQTVARLLRVTAAIAARLRRRQKLPAGRST